MFGSGEGLRHITYYAQSAEPLAANDLFYAFAGLSNNAQYVVMAIFPLDASFLPQVELSMTSLTTSAS